MPGFSKSERLFHYRLRKLLFSCRHELFCFPFKIKYLVIPVHQETSTIQPFQARQTNDLRRENVSPAFSADFPARCLITVSAKRFRHATKRNRIKRLVREAYRKNKHMLYAFLNHKALRCLVAFTYVAPGILSFSEIESKMTLSLQNLSRQIEEELASSQE